MRRPPPNLDELCSYFHGVSRATTIVEDRLRRLDATSMQSAEVPRALREIAERYRSALEVTRSIGKDESAR
jgi:hypothetical protein